MEILNDEIQDLEDVFDALFRELELREQVVLCANQRLMGTNNR